MKITVIGTGYVGLVTAAIFAHFNNQVGGIDIDQDKIKNLQAGQVPFYEPGLAELVKQGLKKGKLYFTNSYKRAVAKSQIIFICVGTPAKENGDYQMKYVYSAVKSAVKGLKKYAVVCIKSTVPPTTKEKIEEIIKKNTQADCDLASCPEFLKEGSAVEDSLHPHRVVIGTESKKAEELLLKLHQPIKAPRVLTDIKSAQTIKYAANAFLATKISFINSIARICDAIGADIQAVSQGLGLDPRIGHQFLKAGAGYGGSCFPKDTWALIAFAKRLGYDFKFLKEVDNINRQQIDYLIARIVQLVGPVKGKTITVLGLAFKPNTDDIRESRSLSLIKKLKQKGAEIRTYDPQAMRNARKVLTDIDYTDDAYQALKGGSALVLMTEWPEFRKIDFKKAGQLMKKKAVIDGRNFLDKEKLRKLGFEYKGVGRR